MFQQSVIDPKTHRFLTFLNGLRITMTKFCSYFGIFIISFTLIACRGPIVTVISNDWEMFHETKDGVDSYYNVNLIRYPTKDTVEVWTKIFVSDDDKKKILEPMTKDQYAINGLHKWSHNICLLEVNCKKRWIRWIQFTYYDDNRNVLYSSSSERKGNWELIEPDSLGDNLQKKVCNINKRK